MVPFDMLPVFFSSFTDFLAAGFLAAGFFDGGFLAGIIRQETSRL